MNPRCDALIVTCFDFRFQPHIDRWIEANLEPGNYDRVAIAGGVKDWDAVHRQVVLGRRLHGVERIVLVNHEDCMAYGEEGTLKRHRLDLKLARERIQEQYPELKVELYFLHQDGSFEPVV